MNVIKSDGSDESAAIFGSFELDPACTLYLAVFDGFEPNCRKLYVGAFTTPSLHARATFNGLVLHLFHSAL